MASAVLRRLGRVPNTVLQRCSYASHAAAVPLSEPLEGVEIARPSPTQPEDVKVTRLSNGITVASLENHFVSSRVSVFIRAGSRYEEFDKRGVTHLLRDCAFLNTVDRTAFRISREMDFIGGTLSSTGTREHVVYSAEFLREGVSGGNLELVMDTLGSVIHSSKFEQWQVKDNKSRVKLEIASAQEQPTQVVLEALHQAAYRNALNNPLYCPPYNLPRLTSDDLKSYVGEHFTGKRITIAGLGVNHDELVRTAQAFSNIPEGIELTEVQAEYIGGSEVMIPSSSPIVHAMVACKGVSVQNSSKDLVSTGVLQHHLGVGPSYLKWGSNTISRLSKVVTETVGATSVVSAMNMSYSDSGLFGLYAVSDHGSIGKVLKAIMHEFSEVAKGNISNEDLTRAKNQLKASYLMSSESGSVTVEDIGLQTSYKASYTPIANTIKLVDAVTKDDVMKSARMVFSTRPTFVALGNLSNTPRLDHLMQDISLK